MYLDQSELKWLFGVKKKHFWTWQSAAKTKQVWCQLRQRKQEKILKSQRMLERQRRHSIRRSAIEAINLGDKLISIGPSANKQEILELHFQLRTRRRRSLVECCCHVFREMVWIWGFMRTVGVPRPLKSKYYHTTEGLSTAWCLNDEPESLVY